MNRVEYDFFTPETFEEHLNFTEETPYILRIKQFTKEYLSPLHYARTIEIVLAENLKGSFVIDSQRFVLGGRQLFVIPPNTVHTSFTYPGIGTQYVLKIDLDMLSRYANIPAILGNHNTSVSNLAHCYSEEYFCQLHPIILELIKHNDDFSYCVSLIVKSFSILKNQKQPAKSKALEQNYSKKLDLHKLVRWTQDNLGSKITVQDAARQFGYSKCYFCSCFKELTGFTFNDYLTSARLSYACKLLLNNTSVTEACYLSGYENVSYFVQLFKRRIGMTPREYVVTFQNSIKKCL